MQDSDIAIYSLKLLDLRNAVRHRLGGGVTGAIPAHVDVL